MLDAMFVKASSSKQWAAVRILRSLMIVPPHAPLFMLLNIIICHGIGLETSFPSVTRAIFISLVTRVFVTSEEYTFLNDVFGLSHFGNFAHFCPDFA